MKTVTASAAGYPCMYKLPEGQIALLTKLSIFDKKELLAALVELVDTLA